MIEEVVAKLRILAGASCGQRASARDIERAESAAGFVFPPAYRKLLTLCSGCLAYDGYVRLFGVTPQFSLQASTWNAHDCWKFAWNGRADEYWCIGETAWGDQYAIRKCDAGQVFLLDANTMQPEQIAETIDEFVCDELLRTAIKPYDDVTVRARERLGPLSADEHLVYVPSLMLGSTETNSVVDKMNARVAMIFGGDIVTQIDGAPGSAELVGCETYVDEAGRNRLRLVWRQ